MKRAALALGVLLALGGCGVPQGETPTAEPTPSPSISSVPGGRKANAVAYSTGWLSGVPKDEEDLWLYELGSGERKRLTHTGRETPEALPRFVDESAVSFVVGGSFRVLNIKTGQVDELFNVPGSSIVAYDWAIEPAHRSVAFVAHNDFTDQPNAGQFLLFIYNPGSGVRRLRDLGPSCDCDAVDESVPSVEWSPRGASLLIGLDWKVRDQLVYVVDPEGKDVVAPFEGWEPRWATDGQTVYAHNDFTWEDNDGVLGEPRPGTWFAVDIASGKHEPFSVDTKSYHFAVSPDGTRAAAVVGGWPYTSPREFVNDIYVFDVQTGEGKKIASGYRDPIWLTPSEIAVTRVKECPGFECLPPNWRGVAGARIDLRTGRAAPFEVRSTLVSEVDVLYE
jgi:hypothetical protein